MRQLGPAAPNIACRIKVHLSSQTDSNDALLSYLFHKLGSAHERPAFDPNLLNNLKGIIEFLPLTRETLSSLYCCSKPQVYSRVASVSFQTNAAVTASVFAHVCHVMTFVPAACVDQLFVLSLDLVARPSVSNGDVIEQLKLSINRLSSHVHRAALMQKLNQVDK